MVDLQERLKAALQDRYRIERRLGEGGMATVYLADDLKHRRKVALKVLKPELAAVVGAERFLAEITVTANLQHPNILPLFDSGTADSFLFYVMPYVDGESLRDRLDREHQLPVDDAVKIATSLAEALDYAHGKGVIHRDIKPANVLLLQGKPVISDFGIALAVGVAGGGRLTETGLSLGTPHYMSPEQATGDAHVGPATDIYALGCVLYEMLVGEPPYVGSTAQAVLGKIIQGAPVSATEIRNSVPRNVDAAIRRALEKVPADRFRGAAEFARALNDPGFRHGDGALAGRAGNVRPWNRLSVAMTGTTILFALVAGWALLRPQPRPLARFEVTPGERLPIALTSVDFSLSPDGWRIVYAALTPTGGRQLWQRALDNLEPVPIPGTEGASDPVLSPDGLSVAFRVLGNIRSIKTVSLSGGPPFTVVGSNEGVLPAWGSDGMIYFDRENVIYRVPATGGEPIAVTTPTDGASHLLPEPLPDGHGLLLTVSRGALEQSRIAVVGPEGGEVREILTGVMARYAASGHVVYATAEGTLMAAPFDVKHLEVTGPPVAMLEGIDMVQSAAKFALSPTGSLLYGTGTGRAQQVVLVDSLGREEVLPIETGSMSSPRFSPDGRFISYVDGSLSGDVYVYSLELGNTTRLTFEGINQHPFWSRDSALVTFASTRSGSRERDPYRVAADMGGTEERLFSLPGSQHPQAWSPDGRLLFRDGPSGSSDLRIASFDGDSVTTTDYLTARWNEHSGTISPDGRWVAYVSNEDGDAEIYVRAFPTPLGSVKVSVDGGNQPVWDPVGRSVYYRTATDFIVARVRTEPQFVVVERRPLFPGAAYHWVANFAQYDISPSGDRFVMLRDATDADGAGKLILVQNFFEELKRLVPN